MPNTYEMKLKPEHLKKFPFYEDKKAPGLLVQLGEDIVFPVSKHNLTYIIENQLKPLLKPISQLKARVLYDKIPEYLKKELSEAINSKNLNNLKTTTKQLLVKNLFDVDGLIENGLALPYNFELKNEESYWVLD